MKILYIGTERAEAQALAAAVTGVREGVSVSWTCIARNPLLYSGHGGFALSDNGTFVYQRKSVRESEVVWVAKDGTAAPLTLEPWREEFFSLSLSPDAKQLVATLTTGWRQRADGSARAERLVADGPIIDEGVISPDGHWAVYRAGGSELVSRDIKALRLGNGAGTSPKALVATRSEEYSPALSGDGRWLAYISEESGRPEVYVRPFPETQNAVWQVSRGGGQWPVWARNGQLFYQTWYSVGSMSCRENSRAADERMSAASGALLERKDPDSSTFRHFRILARMQPVETALHCACVDSPA